MTNPHTARTAAPLRTLAVVTAIAALALTGCRDSGQSTTAQDAANRKAALERKERARTSTTEEPATTSTEPERTTTTKAPTTAPLTTARPTTTTAAPTTTRPPDPCPVDGNTRVVSAACIEPWPLTVASGTLSCVQGAAVLFAAEGRQWAVNGTAVSWDLAPRIDPIWAADETLPKVNIGSLIDAGLDLC